MKKTKKQLMTDKILAHLESLLIWDRISKTGAKEKANAIIYLYERNLISKYKYIHHCPLCDVCNVLCWRCMWPGHKCNIKSSPYYKWKNAKNKNERKRYAREMIRFLMTIDF